MKFVILLVLTLGSAAAFASGDVRPIQGLGVSVCTFPDGTCGAPVHGQTQGRRDVSEKKAELDARRRCAQASGALIGIDQFIRTKCNKDFEAGTITCTSRADVDCMVR